MPVSNYASLPLGTLIDNGEIKICVHCGKPGLEEKSSGKTFYTHYQSAGINERGAPEIYWDMCPKFAKRPTVLEDPR
jgi:hypothetical protein